MKNLKSYFHFYFSKFFISLAFGIIILMTIKIFPLAFISLILSSLLVWFIQHYINDKKKQTLYFYFNQGISEFKLYLFTFTVNLTILIIINYIVR